MRMALVGTTLYIIEANSTEYNTIMSWGRKMTWDKSQRRLEGYADLELLTGLSRMVRLPPAIEQRRRSLQEVQDAVDRERVNEKPVPFIEPPVKLSLYAHQTRGYNMALLAFGWVPPEASPQKGA